ncbi:hypothetical protein [Azohydromonas aeria]|nr:hypothetical protein [Azohydromonas aeria]
MSRYAGEPTQGPACTMAAGAGAGTVYCDYLVPLRGRHGQTAER